MPQFILLRGAKQLLTLHGPPGERRGAALHELGIIEDGSVLIQDGVIAAVGTTRRLENLKEARNALEIPVDGRLVMPGLVDPGLGLSLDRPGEQHRRKRMTEFHDDSLSLLRSCLQHGTLASELKVTAHSTDLGTDVSLLRKLAKIGSNPVRTIRTWRVNALPPPLELDGNGIANTFALLARRGLLHSLEITPESEGAVADTVLAEARLAGIRCKLIWKAGSPERLSQLIDRLQPSAVYSSSGISEGDVSILSQSSAVAVFAADRKVFEGGGDRSVRQVADAGGAIALSSGYESSSIGNYSMQMVIALAVARLELTPEEAISAATINAAHAVGCGDITGSLEYGKDADILVMNVPDYRELPPQFGMNHVEMAIRQGTVVLNRTRRKATPNRG